MGVSRARPSRTLKLNPTEKKNVSLHVAIIFLTWKIDSFTNKQSIDSDSIFIDFRVYKMWSNDLIQMQNKETETRHGKLPTL